MTQNRKYRPIITQCGTIRINTTRPGPCPIRTDKIRTGLFCSDEILSGLFSSEKIWKGQFRSYKIRTELFYSKEILWGSFSSEKIWTRLFKSYKIRKGLFCSKEIFSGSFSSEKIRKIHNNPIRSDKILANSFRPNKKVLPESPWPDQVLEYHIFLPVIWTFKPVVLNLL